MKLKEYLENLQELVKTNPETLEMDVVYSKDAEGNGFDKIYDGPSIGVYHDREFIPLDSEDYEYKKTEIRAICIN